MARDKERRRQRDHERYMAHRDERRAYQREYYAKNRDAIRRRWLERASMKVVIH